MSLTLDAKSYEDVVVLRVAGRVDQDTSETFQAKMLDIIGDSPNKLAIDFSDVPYISSVGLRAIMVASKQSKATKGAIAISELQPTVEEVFTISRFNFVIPVKKTLSEAVGEMSETAKALLEAE